jgi:hypothetical protein
MKDFLQLPDGDLDFSNGDISYVDASLQHQRDTILTRPGALKHAPTVGVGVEDYFNDDSPEDLLRKTRQEMLKDGMNVKKISVDETGRINILGYYEADYNNK